MKYYFLLLFFGLISCGEEVDFFVPLETEGEKGNIRSIMTKMDKDPVYRYIGGMEGGQVAFGDIYIDIPPGSFSDADGKIYEGEVRLNLKSLNSISEIIRHQVPTISNTELLTYDGGLEFEAYAGSEKLNIKEGSILTMQVSRDMLPQGMEVFYGSGSGVNFEWLESDGDPQSTDNISESEWMVVVDSDTIIKSGFSFEVDQSGMWAWAEKSNFPKAYDFCVQLPEDFESANTLIYVILKAQASVSVLHHNSEGLFCSDAVPLPVEQESKIIVLGDILGQAYMSQTSTIITNDQTIELTPVPTSIDEIREVLDNQ